jgi:hypothetical protein
MKILPGEWTGGAAQPPESVKFALSGRCDFVYLIWPYLLSGVVATVPEGGAGILSNASVAGFIGAGMELYRLGDIQQTEAFNVVCSFGKRAGKVCWFFEKFEQGLRAVNAVAFGICRLLHNSDTLQPLDCALCGREGNAQLAGNARGGDERIGRQQIDNPQRSVG